MKIDDFTNEKYKLLKFLKSKEIYYNNSVIVRVSQDEMAEGMLLSKHTINTMVKELIELGAVANFDLKGKYLITNKANNLLDKMSKDERFEKASRFKCGSFFAGVGGIDLGFAQAGFETVYANELDPKAVHTYENYFNLKVDCRDIKEVTNNLNDEADLINRKFDILLAGFPCQSFSIAGYREGFEDKKGRGGLFFEIMKIVKEKNPAVVFLENVKNLVGHDNGKTFKIIEEALISEGYYIKKSVLNSMEYGNLPQNRERIYIVAFKDKNKRDEFRFPFPVKLERKLESVIDFKSKVDDKFYYTNKFKHYDEIKNSITKQNTCYQWRRVYVRENKSNVCPTLTANMGTGGHNVPLILTDYGIRKLTPKECFALQGYPESYKLPDDISMSYLYKQAGNSVSVSVIKRIADEILKVL